MVSQITKKSLKGADRDPRLSCHCDIEWVQSETWTFKSIVND